MRRAKQLLLHTSAMTATSLLMRTIALVFQVYVAGRIGAAGIGLFQLVMSVYTSLRCAAGRHPAHCPADRSGR